jgi:hypothetical protein
MVDIILIEKCSDTTCCGQKSQTRMDWGGERGKTSLALEVYDLIIVIVHCTY